MEQTQADVIESIVKLDHEIKFLTDQLKEKKAWLIDQHKNKVRKGGRFKLDDRVVLCAYKGVEVTTSTEELTELLDSEETDEFVRSAFKHKGYALRQEIYDAMPIDYREVIDQHIKVVKKTPYVSVVGKKKEEK